jgi:hypothetical protein
MGVENSGAANGRKVAEGSTKALNSHRPLDRIPHTAYRTPIFGAWV